MRILQLIDSLDVGGAERMAVNYANALQKKIEFSGLCTTRNEGVLKALINTEIPYLFLKRKRSLDVLAVLRLKRFIKQNNIQVLHAHGSSYFIAALVKLITPGLKLIWHDHFGNSEFLEKRDIRYLKIFSNLFDSVFSVNELLKGWAQQELKINQAFYVKNFIAENLPFETEKEFAGTKGKRIVCVANFRPQKNHHFLLNAFEELLEQDPELTLHLFGNVSDTIYGNSVEERLEEEIFINRVFYHGTYMRMSTILPHFDIGVLSSDSEGLPLALLEYGQAGLAVVTTNVGQCKEVIGDAGVCVSVRNKKSFVEEVLNYTINSHKMKADGINLKSRVSLEYGEQKVLNQILKVYNEII